MAADYRDHDSRLGGRLAVRERDIASPDAVPILKLEDISVAFGGILALDGVSFVVGAGSICGLIGANGAGKTTLFNCLSRLCTPTRGRIVFDGLDLLRLPAHQLAARGIGRTFQNLALFGSMSVRENVLIGFHARMKSGFAADMLRLSWVRTEQQTVNAEADELIDFLDLANVTDIQVSRLPFVVCKRVELARALAAYPKLLLLDEPAAGLSHEEVEKLLDLIGRIRDRFKLTILLVEHHMNMVMRASDQVVALSFGRVIADGRPAEVQRDSAVVKSYLGVS